MIKTGIRRYIPSSLYSRALLILIIPTILLQAVSVYVFYARHWSSISRQLSSSLAGEIAMISGYLEENRGPSRKRDFLAKAELNLNMKISINDESGADKYLKHGENLDYPAFNREMAIRMPNRFRVALDENQSELITAIELSGAEKREWLVIIVPSKRLLNPTTYIFVMWMTGTALVLMVISIIFLRNQLKPILRLSRFAEKFGRGQDVVGFKPEGAAEIRQAGKAFMMMRERIRRHLKQRTEMLAGISHDLRTPLTRMKLQLAMIAEKKPEITGLKSLGADISDMETMINSYLDFVRGKGEEETSEISLHALAEETALQFSGQINIGLDPDEVTVTGRPGALKRALSNLLANSVKYGASAASVTIRQEGNDALIIVDDNGPGIPEDKFAEVFRPFFRLEESRNIETGGAGLGLSIVRDVVNDHGGEVHLENLAPHGLRVIISLPV